RTCSSSASLGNPSESSRPPTLFHLLATEVAVHSDGSHACAANLQGDMRGRCTRIVRAVSADGATLTLALDTQGPDRGERGERVTSAVRWAIHPSPTAQPSASTRGIVPSSFTFVTW